MEAETAVVDGGNMAEIQNKKKSKGKPRGKREPTGKGDDGGARRRRRKMWNLGQERILITKTSVSGVAIAWE
ncbi:hypothetical protein V6N13_041226 [Hibiscus sabdariffa]